MRRAVWAILALAVVGVGMFLFGYPTRTYLEQRSSLASEQATVARLSAQNRSLQSEAAGLQTNAEIERLAREDYGLVQPGQEAYAILPAPIPPKATSSAGSSGKARSGSAGSGAAGRDSRGAAGSGSDGGAESGSVWSRLVHQLEFWS